jgi:PIN domain nuclease of toxin-antitoxin system
MRYVLDASALLCVLLLEPGARRVEAVLSGAKVTVVNYAEVLGKLNDRGLSLSEIVADLSELDIDLVPVDVALAQTAAALKRDTQAAGLSLGDRFCLALARHEDAIAVTTDSAWAKVADAIAMTVEQVR